MESHLTLRLTILHDLMQYLLNRAYPLSRSTRWKLLTNAERLAAARAVWRKYDSLLAQKDRENICLLEQAIDAAIERYKNDDSSEINDVDDVRLWFTKHVNIMEKLLPTSFAIIKSRSRDDQLHKKDILHLCREMNDLVTTTLGAAFEGKLVYFMSVDSARFRRPVFPGDCLHVQVLKQRHRGNEQPSPNLGRPLPIQRVPG